MNYPEGFQREKHSRKPICGVLSVALCAGVSYDVAHAACKQAMIDLKLGQRFGGKTWDVQREYALKRLAVKFTPIISGLGWTLRDWIETRAERDVTYMICVSRHVLTVRNNCVTDQYQCANILLHKNRDKRVKKVWRIDGKGW